MKRSIKFNKENSFVEPIQHHSSRQYMMATFAILLLALLHVVMFYAVVVFNFKAYRVRNDEFLSAVFNIYGIALVTILFFYPVVVFIFVRPKRFFSYMINSYRWEFFSKEKLFFSYPVLVIMPIHQSVYTFFKREMPNLNSFRFDGALHNIDKAIFLGNEPWRVFQCIIGYQNITRVMDFLYYPIWMSLLVVFFLYHALGSHSLKIRLRFFLCYIIVWAGLGNALATVLSSAGPCYFTQVTGEPSPYAELMRYLYLINIDGRPLYAVQLQELLWNCHVNAIFKNGSGISAMPSIHVATAALFGLSMRHKYDFLEKLFYCYTVVIWVGSIHLGWHYAVDGPVAVLCVVFIWYFLGKLTDIIITKGSIE